MKNIFLALLLLPASIFAGGMEELRLMNKKYVNASSYSMAISVSAYSKKSDVKPELIYTGEVKKQEDMFYSAIAGRKTIINTKYSIVVDDNNNIIVVGKSNGRENKAYLNSFIDTDSLFDGGFNYKIVSKNKTKMTVEITAKEPDYWENVKMEMVLDAVDHSLLETIIYPKTGQGNPDQMEFEKVHIRYSKIQLDSKIPLDSFSEKTFVDIKKTKVVAIGKYSGYKVINQLVSPKRD